MAANRHDPSTTQRGDVVEIANDCGCPDDTEWNNDQSNPLNWPAGKKALLVVMGSATAFTTLVFNPDSHVSSTKKTNRTRELRTIDQQQLLLSVLLKSL